LTQIWVLIWLDFVRVGPELANLPGGTVRIGVTELFNAAQIGACRGAKNKRIFFHGAEAVHSAGRLVSACAWRFLYTDASITILTTSPTIGQGAQFIVLEDPHWVFWFFFQVAARRVINIQPRSVKFVRHRHFHHTCQLCICE